MVRKTKPSDTLRVLDQQHDRGVQKNSSGDSPETPNTKEVNSLFQSYFRVTKPYVDEDGDTIYPSVHHATDCWKIDIGLDISTSYIGVCFLNKKTKEKINIFHIDLTSSKFKNMWEKVDFAMQELGQKIRWYQSSSNAGPPRCIFKRVFVEANAKKYSSKFSSADTLFTLAKMNGIISYECHKQFGLEIIDVNVVSARSAIGYKDKRSIKRPVKEKVREFVLATYPEITCETRTVTKGKNKGAKVPVPGAADEIDAWVIVRGGQLLQP
jgi:hypothetical protein